MRGFITTVCAALLSLHSATAQEGMREVVPASVVSSMSMEERLAQLEQQIEWMQSEGGGKGFDSKGCCVEECNDCCWDNDWYVSLSGGWNARERATEVDAPMTFLQFTNGFGLNLALGMRRDMWRMEAEASYLNNYIQFASAQGVGAGPADGNIGLQLYMLNLYRDFCLTDRLRPYIGAGVGIGQSEINGLRPAIFAPAGPPLDTTGINATSDWPFAWQARLGLSYALGCRTEAFVGYRYVHVYKFEFTHFPFGEFRPNGSRNHNVEVGIRVNF